MPRSGSWSSWACHRAGGSWLIWVAGVHSPVGKELCGTAGRGVGAHLPSQGRSGALRQEARLDRNCALTDGPPRPRGAVTHTAHRLHHPGLARLLLADEKGVLCAAGPLRSSWPRGLPLPTRGLTLTCLRPVGAPGRALAVFPGAPWDPRSAGRAWL